MCLVCGLVVSGIGIEVSRDGLAVHRGTCHQRWMRAVGFERLRLIDRGRLAARRGQEGPDRRAWWPER